MIGNILLHLIDTAGIRETENEIESIGIKKTKESLEKADFVIIVLDSSKELSKEDYEILDLCKNSTGVVLVNKSGICNRHCVCKKYVICQEKTSFRFPLQREMDWMNWNPILRDNLLNRK